MDQNPYGSPQHATERTEGHRTVVPQIVAGCSVMLLLLIPALLALEWYLGSRY